MDKPIQTYLDTYEFNVLANRVWEYIGPEELYMQLAEEAAELSQACSKMARYLHHTNPVDKHLTKLDLEDNVIEELADVSLLMRMVVDWSYVRGHSHDNTDDAICKIEDYKMKRWLQRLEEADNA